MTDLETLKRLILEAEAQAMVKRESADMLRLLEAKLLGDGLPACQDCGLGFQPHELRSGLCRYCDFLRNDPESQIRQRHFPEAP